jgi:hypothetical protein
LLGSQVDFDLNFYTINFGSETVHKQQEKDGDSKMKTIPSNCFSQYILTLTLYEHLCSFKKIGLKIPDRSMIDRIEEGLINHIKKVFQGVKTVVEIIRFGDFCDEIESAAKGIKARMPDAIVVSTTPMIASGEGGICFGLSRLIDIDGKIMSIGSRAGFHSVERQIVDKISHLSGHRVIILEDGSFTGGTLCFMLDKLSGCGAKIEAIVMGILFPDAKKKLLSSFKGELICKYHFENPCDWMPSHDFFPFIPNAGRVIGTKAGDSFFPLHPFDDSTLSKPYILPYGQLDQWAGLPLDQSGMVEISRHCIDGSIEIFDMMEKLNGKTIKIEDLIKSIPTTSVPLACGKKKLDFYDIGNSVIDILRDDSSWLNESM